MSRHSVSYLYAHLVFVTKFRRKILTNIILEDFRIIFNNICLDYKAQLVEFEGEDNHVHLLIRYLPTIKLSDLVRSLKTHTSSLALAHYNDLIIEKLWCNKIWSPSYFIASCGGAPLDIIKVYIQNQDKPRT